MSSGNFDQFDLFDEFEDIGLPKKKLKNAPTKRQRARRKDIYNKISEPEIAAAIHEQADDRRTLDTTYKPAKSEADWLTDSLGGFFEQQWFDDVLMIVKGGKEASVYQLKGNATTGQPFLAGKVYRPRMFRALKNDHMYRQGRDRLDEDGLQIIDEGKLKAMDQRSAYGKRLSHQSWIEHEVRTMEMLYDAGCNVPRYFASGDNAILMEYFGNADIPAPMLSSVRLEKEEAYELFEIVMENIDVMLAYNRVHGDLSAFNILYWEGDITIIDFPQAINPHKNPNGFQIFERDVTRVCEYFIKQGVDVNPKKIARGIWADNGLRSGPQVDIRHLDAEDEDDKRYWEKYK
jgi:RIO kinase 1